MLDTRGFYEIKNEGFEGGIFTWLGFILIIGQGDKNNIKKIGQIWPLVRPEPVGSNWLVQNWIDIGNHIGQTKHLYTIKNTIFIETISLHSMVPKMFHLLSISIRTNRFWYNYWLNQSNFSASLVLPVETFWPRKIFGWRKF